MIVEILQRRGPHVAGASIDDGEDVFDPPISWAITITYVAVRLMEEFFGSWERVFVFRRSWDGGEVSECGCRFAGVMDEGVLTNELDVTVSFEAAAPQEPGDLVWCEDRFTPAACAGGVA